MKIPFVIITISLCVSLTFAIDGLEIPSYTDTAAIVRHSGFVLHYVEQYEQPSWVAYELDKSKTSVTMTVINNFRPDPLVPTGSATLDDYRNSGYDRGHLFPAADAWDSLTMFDCFYLSNISPQEHLFNAGVWSRVEAQVRAWALEYDTIYVATGPILRPNLPTIGLDSVAVPEYFYKVVLCINSTDTMGIGFLLKGEDVAGPLSQFMVTIDSVESISGIDFFPDLPDDVELKVEGLDGAAQWLTPNGVIAHRLPQSHAEKAMDIQRLVYYDIMGRRINLPVILKSHVAIMRCPEKLGGIVVQIRM